MWDYSQTFGRARSMSRHPHRSDAAPLASLAIKAVGELIARRGAGQAAVFARWPDIVGPAAAEYMRPVEFQWPKSRSADRTASEGATLIVAVDSARAIEAQFAAEPLVRSVNAHLGWKCVRSIAFRQERFQKASAAKQPIRIDRQSADRIDEAVKTIDDEKLRENLFRLGLAVATATAGNGGEK